VVGSQNFQETCSVTGCSLLFAHACHQSTNDYFLLELLIVFCSHTNIVAGVHKKSTGFFAQKRW